VAVECPRKIGRGEGGEGLADDALLLLVQELEGDRALVVAVPGDRYNHSRG